MPHILHLLFFKLLALANGMPFRFVKPGSYFVGVPKGSVKLDPPLFQQYQAAKAGLTRELQGASQRVTHAMALSALSQAEANDLTRVIEDLKTSNSGDRAIGHPEGLSSAYPDFPYALAALRNQVLEVLDTKLKGASDQLRQDLQEYADAIGDDAGRDVARIREMLQANNPASLRTAHDAFTFLRNGGKLPPHTMNPGRSVPEDYERFLGMLASEVHSHHPMLDTLRDCLLEPAGGHNPECIRHLSANERAEAAQFIMRWVDACLVRDQSSAAEKAGDFFSAIGILPPYMLPDTTRANRHTRFCFPDRAIVINDCFIPPALGSRSTTVMGFLIHGNGNQMDSEITSIIQDVGAAPTFILSRARMTLSKRAKLSGHSPVILIDDNLVAYMALHPEDRARRMIEVATLTFYTHPYDDYGGSPVPKEMFFGRQRELNSLRQIKSFAILYGGRRLGKSSLLAQIERETNTSPGNAAVYLQMDNAYIQISSVRTQLVWHFSHQRVD